MNRKEMDRKEWSERKAKLDAEMMEHPFLNDFTRAQRSAAEKEDTLALLADYGQHSKKEWMSPPSKDSPRTRSRTTGQSARIF